jgi:hypothetical protein
MKILIPLEIEFEVDEVVMGGKITEVVVRKKVLTQKEINKLFISPPKKGGSK